MRWCRLRLLVPAMFFLGLLAPAGRAMEDGAAPVTDPAKVAAHYQEVLKEPQFQEPPEADTGAEWKTWLSDCLTRLGAKFHNLHDAREMPRLASMLTAVLVLAALIGLIYVAVRLMRRRAGFGWARENQAPPRRLLHPPEFYEEELRRAVAESDWHSAWLASWRQFLSRLEKGQLVPADRSRTNREYLAQLQAQPQSGPALALVGGAVEDYDRFIYGKRAIAEPEWRSFQGQLDEAALLLHLYEPRPTPAPSSP